jgi:uncharacterized membrane protein
LLTVGTAFASTIGIERLGGLVGHKWETVKRPMKILILMAIFSAIAVASYRQEQSQLPKPAA